MKLKEWVERTGRGAITLLHRRSGVATTTIDDILLHGRIPRVSTARKLSEATDGVVTVPEILGLDDEPKRREDG